MEYNGKDAWIHLAPSDCALIRLATELVKHLRSRETTRAETPITHVDAAGALSLWRVTVTRVG